MSRFKVGDRVRVVATEFPRTAPNGSVGVVISPGYTEWCMVQIDGVEMPFYDFRLEPDNATTRIHTAAPDLLAVAEWVAEHFADTDAPLGIAARAAIAKAKGGA